jgi:lipopolysaccharide/colanic/teichoic acid biosynthesis glycosyltransferase
MLSLRQPIPVDAIIESMPALHASGAVASPAVPRALTSRAKRTMDVSLALLLLILTAPIWLLVAIAIKLTSPGSVFFRQERLGEGGRPFTLYKFRTMAAGASDEPHRQFIVQMISSKATSGGASATDSPAVFKLRDDARITRVGRWLRRTSLDELPQLINVLKGEMSLIGPRPPLAYEVEKYEPWQMERLSVRPGISGLWQVSGRNRLSYIEMCALDVVYIREWRFSTDLLIALWTPLVLFGDRGAGS